MHETHLWWTASACAVLALTLGAIVAQRDPAAIDVAAFALRGRATAPAHMFTTIGRGAGTLLVAAAALLVAVVAHRGIAAVATLVAVQGLSQVVNAVLKLAYQRARPVEWYGYRERDLSFPSGHSVTAIVLFSGLAVIVLRDVPLPAACVLAVPLLATAAGIVWSRLALGAHYFTDVAGGMLLGTAWLCVALALAPHVASIAAMSSG